MFDTPSVSGFLSTISTVTAFAVGLVPGLTVSNSIEGIFSGKALYFVKLVRLKV